MTGVGDVDHARLEVREAVELAARGEEELPAQRQPAAVHRPADGSEFDPWNGCPSLGRRIGIIYRGPHSDEPARFEDDEA